MRILVVSNKCPPDYDGGYELSALQVATALRERGHDVQFVTSHFRSSYTGTKDDPDWVTRIFRYREFEVLTGPRILRPLKDAKRIARMTSIGEENASILAEYLAKNPHFDIAYCFGLHGIGLATAHALAQAKLPILWHAGNYLIAQDLELRSPIGNARMAHRLGVHLFAKRAYQMILEGDYRNIAFLSDAMRHHFAEMGVVPKRTYVIPRGIDFPIRDCGGERAAPPTFLMACRIAEEKGFSVVLDAAQKLHRKEPGRRWELHVAGNGRQVYIDSLIEKAKRAGIDHRIKFLGMLNRDQVLDEMRKSSAFISASIWEEPFGRTNIEALACCAPLIAADAGAIREIVADSDCALIYPREDSEELSRSLERILVEPNLGRTLAERGVGRVREAYGMAHITDLTEAALSEVSASSV